MKGSTTTIIVSLAVAAGLALLTSANQNRYRPDPWITLKTKIALLTDIDVGGRRVDVDTVDGHVTLHGAVSSTKEMNRAAEVAKRIEGAIEVRNLLHVAPDSSTRPIDVCDDELQKAVKTARGIVGVRRVASGVRSVKNNLRVAPE